MMRTLEIGGIVIPAHASHELEQSYEDAGPASLLRMMDGSAVLQGTWSRIRTTITGSGMLPPGLAMLDRFASHVIKCVAERALDSPSNAITLPAARRTDAGYSPYGLAVMADHSVVASAASLVGNVLTITPVSGAIGYRATYWPQFTGILLPWRESVQVRAAQAAWEIAAEEI